MALRPLGSITQVTTGNPWLTVIVAIILTIGLALFIKDVSMNENYMDMEPEGLESIRLQREIPKRFNISADNMVAITDSLEEAGRLTDLLNERPSIGFVESMSDYLPSQSKQKLRIPLVTDIS